MNANCPNCGTSCTQEDDDNYRCTNCPTVFMSVVMRPPAKKAD